MPWGKLECSGVGALATALTKRNAHDRTESNHTRVITHLPASSILTTTTPTSPPPLPLLLPPLPLLLMLLLLQALLK